MIMKQSIIISKCLNAELDFHIKSFNPDKVFIIVDNITEKFCLPRISDIPSLKNAGIISICSTDNSKKYKLAYSRMEIFKRTKKLHDIL